MAPCDDVVYEVPVLRVWVHPGDLVDFWLLEEGVGSGEALLSEKSVAEAYLHFLAPGHGDA